MIFYIVQKGAFAFVWRSVTIQNFRIHTSRGASVAPTSNSHSFHVGVTDGRNLRRGRPPMAWCRYQVSWKFVCWIKHSKGDKHTDTLAWYHYARNSWKGRNRKLNRGRYKCEPGTGEGKG